MKYCPVKDMLMIDTKELKSSYFHIRRCLVKIRQLAGLPLDKYETNGPLELADFAQISLLDLASGLGIDLGVEDSHSYNEIDLRDFNT